MSAGLLKRKKTEEVLAVTLSENATFGRASDLDMIQVIFAFPDDARELV
jgi:hypothetical protein